VSLPPPVRKLCGEGHHGKHSHITLRTSGSYSQMLLCPGTQGSTGSGAIIGREFSPQI